VVQPTHQAGGGGSTVPCNGSVAAVHGAVDSLLRRERANATDSSHSRSSSASSDVIDSHHVTTRSQLAHARTLRQQHTHSQ